MRLTVCGLLILSLSLVAGVGCSRSSGGTDKTKTRLDTSTRIGSLRCENEGLFGDTCVLDNPNNPFADSYFKNLEAYFKVAEDLPSALSAYYLWATALANEGAPELQFLVAQSLHALYTEGGDPLVREQAIKAYRSALDNFFDATFFFTADYLTGEPLVGIAIKNLIAENLANSFERGFTPLVEPFEENLGQAQALVGLWGYSIRLVVAPDLSTPDDPNDTVVQYIMERNF
jgi:hypothetical protein